MFSRDDLLTLAPRHETFLGIDSDGCVFDTMEVKQKHHFHPLIVRFWHLEPIEAQVRRAAEFINLYSTSRGRNRFVNLLELFRMLPNLPGVREAGIDLPPTRALQAYVDSGLPLGNPSLAAEAERMQDPELHRLLEWSLAINHDIDRNMAPVDAFPWARKCLEHAVGTSDIVVVSQTPEEALVKEWRRAGLAAVPRVIAGQELGTKTEHIRMATADRYPPHSILMVGDAPGDRQAAAANGILFYPINPGHEGESWKRFHDEAYGRFLAGTYTGTYESELLRAFEALLPDTPPWAGDG